MRKVSVFSETEKKTNAEMRHLNEPHTCMNRLFYVENRLNALVRYLQSLHKMEGGGEVGGRR